MASSHQPQMEYDIKGKGLFVIINQIQHNFYFFDKNFNENEVPTLNYDEDVKRILKTFHLSETSYNLLLGKDLTSTNTKDSLDSFMTKVAEFSKFEPSFLILFLMSHGGEDGSFLLSTKHKSKLKTLTECCGGLHKFEDQCNARRVVPSVIAPVQNSKKFDNIPKIFVLQTCRGSYHEVTKKDEPDAILPISSTGPSATELFLPKLPDTFVLRACVEGNAAYVTGKRGSLLVNQLCKSISDMEKEIPKVDSLLTQIYLENRPEGRRHNTQRQHLAVYRFLCHSLSRENLVGGWITDVCQKTTLGVTRVPAQYKQDTTNGVNFDKQQPHVSSSLAYRLSVIKLLETQRNPVPIIPSVTS